MNRYLRLVATDSLWSLFGKYGFWNDDHWWESNYEAAGKEQLENMQYTFLLDIKNWEATKTEGVPPSTDQVLGPRDSLTEVSW
ncbi:MAG: hypothetical protein NTW07_05215, partial [candidate division Zixibacteria bacterium]|nr:hypothetical protein [candidate division Zixibacteria bacterium]